MSVRDNLTISTLERVATVGVLRGRRERLAVDEIVRQLRIVTVRPALQQVQNLSGGNQQKALVGRWLLADAAIFLLFDITRGVDIGTKQELYELMVSLAAMGKSLVVYSTEAEELAHLCHRVLVMREGRVVSELSGADLVAERLVHEALHSTDSVKVPAP
jgi:ribose transport system ATP-binding protein